MLEDMVIYQSSCPPKRNDGPLSCAQSPLPPAFPGVIEDFTSTQVICRNAGEIWQENYRRQCSQCKYCGQKGHFDYKCQVPHHLCHSRGVGKCLILSRHHCYTPHDREVCIYTGSIVLSFSTKYCMQDVSKP